jgi:hypothetical protein
VDVSGRRLTQRPIEPALLCVLPHGGALAIDSTLPVRTTAKKAEVQLMVNRIARLERSRDIAPSHGLSHLTRVDSTVIRAPK